MTFLPAVVVLLVILLLVMAVWSFQVTQGSRQLLMDQLEESKLQVIRMEKEIARLTTIIASKDPMTFQVLSAPQTTSLNSEPEAVYLTDEMEAQQWREKAGLSVTMPDGTVIGDEDMTDDLRMLGL